MSGQLLNQLQAFRCLILTFLRNQEFHSFLIVIADIGLQHVDIAVLAAQSQHQDPARIGMVHQIRQNLPGMLLILPHLGAAVRVWERNDLLHPFPYGSALRGGKPGIGPRRNGSGYIVHTAHGGNNPDLVADTRPAVRAQEAHKGTLLPRLLPLFCQNGFISVLQQIPQSGFEIVGVNPSAGPDILLRIADTVSVFDDAAALRDIENRHLMPCRYLLQGRDLPDLLFRPVLIPDSDAQDLPRRYGLQRHHHIVLFVNFYKILHNAALIPFSLISFRYAVTAPASPGT